MAWGSKRILITGGSGFLGSHLVEHFEGLGFHDLFYPRSREFDLRDAKATGKLFRETQPEVVIHLAGTVGGIGANKDHPGKFFYDNALMGIQLLELARQFGVQKFVTVGSICSYPKNAKLPLQEDALWEGYPEDTNAPYGIAKKILLVQGQAYRQEYGFNAIYLLPANLYGPRENFDLETSHVVPAIIRKCFEAKLRGDLQIVLWGDGSPTRDFLYVEDAARGIASATLDYNHGDPVNLGTGVEISIRDVATLIAYETGFQGEILWDPSRPSGQLRRVIDVTRAQARFGFKASTSFTDGIRRTVRWFQALQNGCENRTQNPPAQELAQWV